MTKLSITQVEEIKQRKKNGEKFKDIAKSLDVSIPAIYFRLHPDKLRPPTSKQVATTIHRARVKSINILGGKCKRCGFSDKRALQIDHINGGGLKELRRIGGYKIYLRIINGDNSVRREYQILCANCNWIKRYENKENRNGILHNSY